MTEQSARVDVLTAEVRTLMVGSRQVTLSVYRQLDEVDEGDIEPFGRVHDGKGIPLHVSLVGRHPGTGALVRAVHAPPSSSHEWSQPDDAPAELGDDWAVFGPTQEDWPWNGTQAPDGVNGPRPYQGVDGTWRSWEEKRVLPPQRPRFAEFVDRRPGYRIRWTLPKGRTVPAVDPGRWDWASDAAREIGFRHARRWFDILDREFAAYDAAKALPLIVLAGLR